PHVGARAEGGSLPGNGESHPRSACSGVARRLHIHRDERPGIPGPRGSSDRKHPGGVVSLRPGADPRENPLWPSPVRPPKSSLVPDLKSGMDVEFTGDHSNFEVRKLGAKLVIGLERPTTRRDLP